MQTETVQNQTMLEALAKEGRLDAEATECAGELFVAGQKVRIEVTARRYVVRIGEARVSLPRTASARAVARAIVVAVGTTPKVDAEALPWRILAGRRLYLVTGVGRRELVLAASEGTARRVAEPSLGLGLRVDEATEAEDGEHEAVLCEDGMRRPIARVLSALAAVR